MKNKRNFLHNHPMSEERLGVSNDHVIVDRIDWEIARKQGLKSDIPDVSIALENKRKLFCLWYYAQSQPLDGNKVFDWFSNEY